MDTLIIGIYGKHYQYYTQQIIPAKGKRLQTVTLILGILAKISTISVWTNKILKGLLSIVCTTHLLEKISYFFLFLYFQLQELSFRFSSLT